MRVSVRRIGPKRGSTARRLQRLMPPPVPFPLFGADKVIVTNRHMARAIELAREVEGRTSPNPPVGAVLVHGGEVVGVGSTQPTGGPHAEIVALRAAGERAHHATLYVTLEPCTHWGRTPPCTDALIRHGVGSVHAAVLDPNPGVQGQGVRRLQEHGIEVILGECAVEADHLVQPHARYMATSMPLVTVFLTGSEDALGRLLRVTDVLLGAAEPQQPPTVRALRGVGGAPNSQVVHVGRSAVVVSDVRAAHGTALAGRRRLPPQVWDWKALLMELGRREITSALVSGGGPLALALLQHRLVDRVVAATRVEVPPGFVVQPDAGPDDSPVAAYRNDSGAKRPLRT